MKPTTKTTRKRAVKPVERKTVPPNVSILTALFTCPEAIIPALGALAGVRNQQMRASLPVTTPAMRRKSCGYQLKELRDSVLEGIGLYAGDVIALESLTPPQPGELIVAVKKESGAYLAGYYYPTTPGELLILGAAAEFYCWQSRTVDVEILGRVVGFDAFHDVDDLE